MAKKSKTNAELAHELFLVVEESPKARHKRIRDGITEWVFDGYKIQQSKDLLALYVWNDEGYYKVVPNTKLTASEFLDILTITPWIYV